MLWDRCLAVTLMYCGQTVGWIKMKLGIVVGLGPCDIVLGGNPAPPGKGAQQPPHFSGHDCAAKRSLISATAELLLNVAGICLRGCFRDTAPLEVLEDLPGRRKHSHTTGRGMQ